MEDPLAKMMRAARREFPGVHGSFLLPHEPRTFFEIDYYDHVRSARRERLDADWLTMMAETRRGERWMGLQASATA